MKEDDPLIRVEMTGDGGVRLTMFTGFSGHDVDLEAHLSPPQARRVAMMLLEESERADLLWERLQDGN